MNLELCCQGTICRELMRESEKNTEATLGQVRDGATTDQSRKIVKSRISAFQIFGFFAIIKA